MTRRIVHITTVPESLFFLSGLSAISKQRGWDVHAISSPGRLLERFRDQESVETHPLPMHRSITPLRDLITAAKLTHLLQELRPTVVHAHTPKGGLIGMIAATAARVPVRIYHMHGLPFETANGLRRSLLLSTERTSSRLAHQVIAQSESLRRLAISTGLCPGEKMKVLLNGSCGVDADREFNPTLHAQHRHERRGQMGASDNAIVFGFVGRLVKDKGIEDLAHAWRIVRERRRDARLLLVGPFETGDCVSPFIRTELERDERVHLTGFVTETAPWYAAMDILLLPTYREGFPTAPLEAAAMGLPVITTTATGAVDSIVAGETGLFVEPGNVGALVRQMMTLADDPQLRRTLGGAGRKRILDRFQKPQINGALSALHEELANQFASTST